MTEKSAAIIQLFPSKKTQRKCSFCGKPVETGKYVSDEQSPKSPVICFECIKLATKILKESEDA